MDSLLTLEYKSTISTFNLPSYNNEKLELFAKRDDLIHTEVSGNKLRKLKFQLKKYFEFNCEVIQTYGGAYSNHLLATASACQFLGVPCVGVVRGEELNNESNSILKRSTQLGMQLVFMNRSQFQQEKHREEMIEKNGKLTLIIPEGGFSYLGVKGCEEIIPNEPVFDLYVVAFGTGTTAAGILKSLPRNAKLLVVPVLKGYDVKAAIQSLIPEYYPEKERQLIIDFNAHFGGYAKSNEELLLFIRDFNAKNEMQIEPVYTGKAMWSLNKFLQERKDLDIKKVLFVHTGGLYK